MPGTSSGLLFDTYQTLTIIELPRTGIFVNTSHSQITDHIMTDQTDIPAPPEKTEEADPLASTSLSDLLQALADPMRIQIISGLDRLGEAGCRDLDLPVSKSTCTHHFHILRKAGIIATRQVGTTRISHLRYAEMEHFFPGVMSAILTSAKTSPLR